jgi:hypothetical protein
MHSFHIAVVVRNTSSRFVLQCRGLYLIEEPNGKRDLQEDDIRTCLRYRVCGYEKGAGAAGSLGEASVAKQKIVDVAYSQSLDDNATNVRESHQQDKESVLKRCNSEES